ncbi:MULTISPECIES: hypothetical protein [Microbacterium]|uniref:hypothetical protein n=1 Tax=Microbacterium TaxID=33882 RepID=UPI00217DABF8|nr:MULTISPECIES: hypothetical protein [Microbacterium]UWF78083.1 hypothetical protein JSY13_03320 [Microbacterium neungamense]WCM56261.1 hypothetical protein JRG78_03345 [Microbacterium sp. EF45047]
MTSPDESPAGAPRVQHVTTKTGRIVRVTEAQAAAVAAQTAKTPTGSTKIIIDPARRTDVLFRVRRDEGHEISSWWMIGAFLVTSGIVIALLSWVPGTA